MKLPEDVTDILFDPRNLACPHSVWAQLRHKYPVAKVRLPDNPTGGYVISGKAMIEAVARNTKVFTSSVDSSVQRWGNDFGPEFAPIFANGGHVTVPTIVTTDPPNSMKYRKIVLEALAPARVAARKVFLQAIIDELVDAMPSGATFDFREAFTIPLPLRVIMEIMGLPREDWQFVFHFTENLMELVDPSTPLNAALENAKVFVEAQKYLEEKIIDYRIKPGDNFLSYVANARTEAGTLLTMQEVLSLAPLTLAAGNETTRNALSTAAYLLAKDHELWQELKQNPLKVENFIEEAVRLEAPAAVTARQATCDTELNGVCIPKGAPVYLLWGSASLDEAINANPESINLGRPGIRNHYSFGTGVHHCAGIHLARTELTMSVHTWLREFETMDLAVQADELLYKSVWAFRAIEHLPICITRHG